LFEGKSLKKESKCDEIIIAAFEYGNDLKGSAYAASDICEITKEPGVCLVPVLGTGAGRTPSLSWIFNLNKQYSPPDVVSHAHDSGFRITRSQSFTGIQSRVGRLQCALHRSAMRARPGKRKIVRPSSFHPGTGVFSSSCPRFVTLRVTGECARFAVTR